VRELGNAVEQAILSTPGNIIEEQNLGLVSMSQMNPDMNVRPHDETVVYQPVLNRSCPIPGTLDEVERSLIGARSSSHTGNVTRAAKILAISRDTLRYRIEKHKFV
jgi:two-component system response regulator AtoC